MKKRPNSHHLSRLTPFPFKTKERFSSYGFSPFTLLSCSTLFAFMALYGPHHLLSKRSGGLKGRSSSQNLLRHQYLPKSLFELISLGKKMGKRPDPGLRSGQKKRESLIALFYQHSRNFHLIIDQSQKYLVSHYAFAIAKKGLTSGLSPPLPLR